MKRRNIVILSSLVGLVLLGILGWNVYGWWLKHKLERYQAELVARGEKLTINDLLANYRAPEFNSADYFLRSTARVYTKGLVDSNPPAAMRMIAPGRAVVGWQRPVLIEGYGAEKPKHLLTNTWEELTDDLERSREGIDLLHEITPHPNLDFHLNYNMGFSLLLPHLAPLKKSAQILSAAALLDLHHGDTASAAQHIRAMLALEKGTRGEPLVISQLVRIAIMQISLNATWELLQSSNVSEADLKLLQEDFAEFGFISSMEQAFELERAMGSSTIHHYREEGGIYDMGSWPGGGGAPAATNLVDLFEGHAKKIFSPNELRKTSGELLWQSALSYEDELKHLQGMSVLIEGLREAATNRPFAAVCSNALARLEPGSTYDNDDLFPLSCMDEMSLSSIRRMFSGSGLTLINSLKKVQTAEANRSLVITAIALKRYQNVHGNYPKGLSYLTPEFMASSPRDPINAQPLRYRLQPEGGFLLYSIGDNGVDDGGDASPTNNVSSFSMIKGKDWVWPQPATPEDLRAWEEKNAAAHAGSMPGEGLPPASK